MSFGTGLAWRTRLKERTAHPHLDAIWPGMLAVDRMTRDELFELQRGRLQQLVDDVALNVPFYRKWAEESGFRPGDPVRLQDLPIVTKHEYRTDPEAFQSARVPAESLRVLKTSGSSGVPFRFRMSQLAADASYACFWRSLGRHGIRPDARRVYLWGRSDVFGASRFAIMRKTAKNAVRDRLGNILSVDAYSLSDRNVDTAVRKIQRFRPEYVHGYVSAIYLIAQKLLRDGRPHEPGTIRAVVTESERLYDFQREVIAEAFGCPVLEHYGCCETGNIVQPDLDGVLRVNDDVYLMETDHQGQAIITSLVSGAYPFIRYNLADLVELGEPRGTLPYASVLSVKGRTLDLVPLPEGGHVHGVALTHALNPHLDMIRKFQIRQRALDDFLVRFVCVQPLPQPVRERIVFDLRRLVGDRARIELQEEAHLEPEASGKFRWVVSDVAGSVDAR